MAENQVAEDNVFGFDNEFQAERGGEWQANRPNNEVEAVGAINRVIGPQAAGGVAAVAANIAHRNRLAKLVVTILFSASTGLKAYNIQANSPPEETRNTSYVDFVTLALDFSAALVGIIFLG